MKENMNRVRSKPPQLVLTQEELSHSRDEMEAIGLPSGAPWVSLNVRDSAWLSHTFPSSTWQLNSHRDSQIESYVLAVQALIDLGWYVVRTGAKVAKKIPLEHPRLVDYPFSGVRSEVLDLYLSSQCVYMISTGTGIDTFAWLNQVPTLYVNYFPHCLIDSYGVPSMVIFKNHLNAQQRFLKLSEILDLQILDPSDSNTLGRLGITFEDNSAEDIANAVLEMNNWVETRKCDSPLTPLQAQLYKTLKSNYSSKVDESMLPRIPTTFLSRNPHWVC
jgi:putative glycosyltransferase (TIGR04372 family)